MHRPHLRRAPGNDLNARGPREFRSERRPAAARAAQHDLGVEVKERLRLPDPRTEHLVAHEPEAAREAEDAAPMTQVEVIGEVREAVVRGPKAAEAVLHDPLDVFNLRRAATRHLLEQRCSQTAERDPRPEDIPGQVACEERRGIPEPAETSQQRPGPAKTQPDAESATSLERPECRGVAGTNRSIDHGWSVTRESALPRRRCTG